MSCNILIVDDSNVTRAVLKKTLRMTDLPIEEIFEASNGQEALDFLSHQSIDLLFTDLNMPGLNGAQLTDQLRADPRTSNLPIVVVTAEACTTRAKRLRRAGVAEFIHKPFSPETVRETLSRILPPLTSAGSTSQLPVWPPVVPGAQS